MNLKKLSFNSISKKLRFFSVIILGIILFFFFRKSESQRILEKSLATDVYDFNNLNQNDENVQANHLNNIQYGYVLLKNDEKVKFWFLSHHLVSDDGGTIYEFPDGERVFCAGYHCCEVQFYEFGEDKLEELNNSTVFKEHIRKYDGIRP